MNKSSDIRSENENFINIEDQTKLKSYSDTYTYDDLIKNIKKVHTTEFYLYSNRIKDGSWYIINLKEYDLNKKNIKEVRIKFMEKDVNNKFIEKSNMEKRIFKLQVNGYSYEEEINSDVVFSEMILLNSFYNSTIIFLSQCNNDENIFFKIEVDYVDFYTEFQNKLRKAYIVQKMIKNNREYTLTSAEFNVSFEGKDIIVKDRATQFFEDTGIVGYEKKMGKYNCYFIELSKHSHKYDKRQRAILALIYFPKIDIVYDSKFIYSDIGNTSYIKNNINNSKKIIVYTHNFILHGDAVYNISLKTKAQLDLVNLKIYLKNDYTEHNLILKYENKQDEYYNYNVTNINEKRMINYMSKEFKNHPYKLIIEIADKEIKNHFEDGAIEISQCYMQQNIRNKTRENLYNENTLLDI